MLWQRVLTALVLIPLVVAGILYLDSALLAGVFGVVVLLGAYELGRLVRLRSQVPLLLFLGVLGATLWLVWFYLPPAGLRSMQWLISAWWVLMTIALLARRRELRRVERFRPGILLLGACVLVAAWASVVNLHELGPHGPALLLFLFVLIWVADSGAYFAGRAFGRRKLSPAVSPGKTWAGAAGAGVGAVLCALLLIVSGLVPIASPGGLVGLCLLVTAVSIGGDLWESLLKRQAGLKDSGTLVPGHGGVLDRIDSLLAAAPVYALGLGVVGLTT